MDIYAGDCRYGGHCCVTGTWVPGGGGGSTLKLDNDAVGGIYNGCDIMI